VDDVKFRTTNFQAPASQMIGYRSTGGGIVRRPSASLLAFFCVAASSLAAQTSVSPPELPGPVLSSPIQIPTGTKIALVITRPVWALSAKAGDPLYAQVSFPSVAGNQVAIPAGTYVQGIIENVTRPTRRSNRAGIEVLFTKIVFANGYTVVLPGEPNAAAAAATPVPTSDTVQAGSDDRQNETLIAYTIQVSTSNDLLLDNGAGLEMTLGAPLTLDAQRVARSVPLARPPQLALMVSATRCRPTPWTPGSPGTPGTPDTVIPGSPGTPDTVIPGGPGMPDTVIPGAPATPDTVIPGTPGTPGTPGFPGRACPPRPFVISSAPVVRKAPTPDPQAVAPTQSTQPVETK